jgi:DNA-binding HxlR family transcriptional regulator
MMVDNSIAASLEKSKAAQLVLALLGKESMSFSELMEATKANPRTLSDRIVELSQNNLISVEKDTKFPFKETITLTKRGEMIAQYLNRAYSTPSKGLSERAKILLYMIHEMGNIVKGTTRMEKLPFLLDNEFGVKLAYQYIAEAHGPYSIELLEEIKLLQDNGYLAVTEEIVPVDKNGETVQVERRDYCLTQKGIEKSKELTEGISNQIKTSVNELKKFNNMKLQVLLDYVHTKYPNYKKIVS